MMKQNSATDFTIIEIAQFKKNINRIDALELKRTNEKLLEAVEESKLFLLHQKNAYSYGQYNMFVVTKTELLHH
jgi:hypothetical protein